MLFPMLFLWFGFGIITASIFLFGSYKDNKYITLSDLIIVFFCLLGGFVAFLCLLYWGFLITPDIVIFGKKKDD